MIANKSETLEAENRSFAKPNREDFYIGLTLALLSSFFIGSSFILKKKGLIKLNSNVNSKEPASLRAAHGGHGYLKEWLWWSGFLTMGVGEVCNFVAYMFAPATLVTPLGAISVLISAVMAAHFLDEKLNTIGKIGCLLTAIGSTVMVIHAPKEGQIKTVDELLSKILDIEFISYCVLSIISLLFLIYLIAPRYGNKNILIYILICSILGSYTVMSCKGISLGIKEIINAHTNISYLYTAMFILIASSCIVIQINYLNKALDIFNTAIVTTVYYVLFTLFVMIASALLFKELLNVSFQDFLGCMCGFGTIVCALCLIHFFKTTSNSKDLEFQSLNSLISDKNDLVTMVVCETNNNITNILKENELNAQDKQQVLNENKYQIKSNQIEDEFYQYPLNNQIVNTEKRRIEVNNAVNDDKEISFLNYLNFNYNNIKCKYFKRNNTNFTAYNYKKLMSDDVTQASQAKQTKREFNKQNTYSFIDTISDDKTECNLISSNYESNETIHSINQNDALFAK